MSLLSSPLTPPPQVFTTLATFVNGQFTGPTIFGAVDGLNNLFTFGVSLRRARISRNGVLQTLNVDVVSGPNAMVFLPNSIPVPGDEITMLGWP